MTFISIFQKFWPDFQKFVRLLTVPVIFLTLFPLGGIFILIRIVVWLIAKIWRRDLKGFVGGLNYLFAQGPTNNFPLNTMGIAIVNGTVEIKPLRKRFHQIFKLRRSNGDLLYQGLQTYWESFLGYPFWKIDQDFDVKNHVRKFDYEALKLPENPSELDLQKIIGKLIKVPWRKKRSPWELLVIHNYRGLNQSVVLIRIDHVLADGLSLYELFKVITQSGWALPISNLSQRKFSCSERLALVCKIPMDICQTFCELLVVKRPPSFKPIEGKEIVFCMSPEIPTDTIKRIKNHFQVNYAAVVYAGMFGAIARAVEKSDLEVPRKLICNVILPKPKHPGGLCIHAEAIPTTWELEASSPQERLLKMQETLKKMSRSSASLGLSKLGVGLKVFPTALLEFLIHYLDPVSPVGIGAAGMPVTTQPEYYNGMEILELITANSTIASLGMMISMGGVNNKQRVSFCAEKNMFASEEISRNLGNMFAEEIQILVSSMT